MADSVRSEHVLDPVTTAASTSLPESPVELAPSSDDSPREDGVEKKEEEVLDGSQVIELQAFLDRKEWIAQKIHVRLLAYRKMLHSCSPHL